MAYPFHIATYYNITSSAIILTLSQTSAGFCVSAVQVFWKHSGKRRNCSLRAISPFFTVFSILFSTSQCFWCFFQCFLPFCRTFCHIHQIMNCHLQTLSVWKSLKFFVWERVKEFKCSKLFTKWQNFRLVQIESICRRQTTRKPKIEFSLRRVANTEVKCENAGNHHFHRFPQCFQRLSFSGSWTVGIVR